MVTFTWTEKKKNSQIKKKGPDKDPTNPEEGCPVFPGRNESG